MKIFLFAILVLFQLNTEADIVDPLVNAKQVWGANAGDTLYKWVADINNDGRKEIFIGTRTGYEKVKHGKNLAAWAVYLQASKNAGYQLSTGIEDDKEYGKGVASTIPKIDINTMYIGPISQLGKSGIVTIDADYSGTPEACIRAFTVVGDHLKETILAVYDPTKGSNPIYKQYLSKGHRTTVNLEKIILK